MIWTVYSFIVMSVLSASSWGNQTRQRLPPKEQVLHPQRKAARKTPWNWSLSTDSDMVDILESIDKNLFSFDTNPDHSQELRGRDFNDQFPKGILEQRTVLIWNKLSKEALMMSLQLIRYMLKSTLSWPEHRSMAVLILCRTPFSNSLFVSIIDISAFSCCYCCWFEIISDVFLGGWTVWVIAQLKHRHTHTFWWSLLLLMPFSLYFWISLTPHLFELEEISTCYLIQKLTGTVEQWVKGPGRHYDILK